MTRTGAQAALLTPLGEGGIGTIAVWGPGSVEVLDRVFTGTRRRAVALAPGSLAHGTVQRDGGVVDEVILARIAPPYPGASEPYFEVNCHGGVVAVRTVLACIQGAGARVVPPSVLSGTAANGAVLAAEAIRAAALALVPAAPTRLAAAMLLHQAAGALARELGGIAGLLAQGDAGGAGGRLDGLLATAPVGRALLSPPKAALLGPPNVGKSTLLNALLEEERVIVHHEPGTTRDVVVERVSVRGVPFDLMDCAGIRVAEDDVEREAVSRAARLASECDVAVVVCDASAGSAQAADAVPETAARVILVLNKTDLLHDGASVGPAERFADVTVVALSAMLRRNIEALEDALVAPYADWLEHCRHGGPVIFDERQAEGLASVANAGATSGAGAALEALVELGAARPYGT